MLMGSSIFYIFEKDSSSMFVWGDTKVFVYKHPCAVKMGIDSVSGFLGPWSGGERDRVDPHGARCV